MDLSKFTSNKNILSRVVTLVYNQVCCQTLFYRFNHIACFVLNFLGFVTNLSDAQETLYNNIIHHHTHKNEHHSKKFKPWKLTQPLSSRRIEDYKSIPIKDSKNFSI